MAANPLSYQDVTSQLPSWLQQWLAWERFHLHKADMFQIRSRDPDFDARYLPQHASAFRLPCFWVRRKHLQVYGQQTAGAELQLFSGPGLDERVLFPIHPSAIEQYRPFLAEVGAEDAAARGLCIWAVPTSSTRTLLAWQDQAPDTALFMKTSLHTPLFGDRRLYLKTVGRSVGFSQLMRSARAELPATFDYLPESVGFVPRSSPEIGGAVIRSIPPWIKEGHIRVAPLFSLLGGDGDRMPLLLTLLERSGMQPLQWVEQVLCAAFARLWVEMSLCRGLILEAHAQDLLLELTPELTSAGRFLYRDFEGLQVDWELRRQQGRPSPADLPHDWSWRETYASWDYPYSDLVWYKLQISLFNYLHFVLRETEVALRCWQERGLIGGPACQPDEVTMIFSRHLFCAIEERFGVAVPTQYNVHRTLHRFTALLLKIRSKAMERGPPQPFRPVPGPTRR